MEDFAEGARPAAGWTPMEPLVGWEDDFGDVAGVSSELGARRASENCGCQAVNWQFLPPLDARLGGDGEVDILVDSPAETVEECAGRCTSLSLCQAYSFSFGSGCVPGRCILAGEGSHPHYVEGVVSAPSAQLLACTCPSAPAAGAFPGSTPEQTHAAFPGGRQPLGLECWPRKQTDFELCSCGDDVQVLQDTADGWPGMCLNLERISGPGTECADSCSDDPECGIWQLAPDGAPGGGGCWQGEGTSCNTRRNRNDMTPLAAQMVQHGQIMVLADTSHVQVMNLRNVMHARFFNSNMTSAIEACQQYCYSDIHCQHWQLIDGTGCWVEDPRTGNSPRYPLVLADGRTRLDARGGQAIVQAGEFIQHYCSERCACGCDCEGVCEEPLVSRSRRRRSATVAQPALHHHVPPWFWPLLGGLLWCCLLCLLCWLCRESGKQTRTLELDEYSDESPRSARVIATTDRGSLYPAPTVPVYASQVAPTVYASQVAPSVYASQVAPSVYATQVAPSEVRLAPSQNMIVGAPPSSFASRALGTVSSFTTGPAYQAVSSFEPSYQPVASYETAYQSPRRW